MTKEQRVFEALLSGRSYNRFEAERQLHDHCLHTSVSTLEKKYQITISRKFEQVPCFDGNKANVKRYWIAFEERERIKNRRQMPDKEKAPTATKPKEAFQ